MRFRTAMAIGTFTTCSCSLAGSDEPSDNQTTSDNQTLAAVSTTRPSGAKLQQTRQYVDPPDSLVLELGLSPYGFAYPVTTVTSSRGDIYVLDFGDSVVRQFTAEGDFVRDYGNGPGEGPGEFRTVVDIAVDDAGQVWTLDPGLARMQVFDTLGSVVQSFRTRPSAYTFERLASGEVVYMVTDSLLFERFNPDGDASRLLFGRVVENQRRNALAVTGFLASDQSTVVYSAGYGGFVGRWSANDGELRYLRPTVVDQNFPNVVQEGGATFVAPEDRRGASFGVSVYGDSIYILSGDGRQRVVDVYEIGRGDYQYSFPLPDQATTGMSIFDGRYILTTDTLVAVWMYRRTGARR